MPNRFATVLTAAEAAARRMVGGNITVLTDPIDPFISEAQARAELSRAYDETRAALRNQQTLGSAAWGNSSLNAFYSPYAAGETYTVANAGTQVIPIARVVAEPSKNMLERVEVTVQDLDLAAPRQKLASDAESILGYSGLRKHLKTPGRLRQALAKLDITILEEKSVNKYKAQMVEHFRSANKLADPTWRITPVERYKQPIPEFVLQKAIEIKKELPEAQFYIDQLANDPFLIVSLGEIPDWSTNQASRKLDPESAAYVEVWDEPKFEATL